MRLFFALFVFLFVMYFDLDANGGSVVGGRPAGLAGAAVSLKGFWAVHNNQAGMAEYNSLAFGISYENRFLIKELGTKYTALIVPVKQSVLGFSLSYFGFNLYNEKKVGLAFARKFGNRFSVGLQLDYIGVRIGNEYSKKDLFTFEAGIQADLSKEITLGFHIFNPPHIKLSDQYKERLPATVKFGITYSFSKKVISVIETEKSSGTDPRFRVGIEYNATKTISFRTGIAVNPFINCFGAGLRFGRFVVDIGSSYQSAIGITTQLSIIYEFKSFK